MIDGYREFEFDLPEALLEKLVQAFDRMEAAPLLKENVSNLPEAQGVYSFFTKARSSMLGRQTLKRDCVKDYRGTHGRRSIVVTSIRRS